MRGRAGKHSPRPPCPAIAARAAAVRALERDPSHDRPTDHTVRLWPSIPVRATWLNNAAWSGPFLKEPAPRPSSEQLRSAPDVGDIAQIRLPTVGLQHDNAFIGPQQDRWINRLCRPVEVGGDES